LAVLIAAIANTRAHRFYEHIGRRTFSCAPVDAPHRGVPRGTGAGRPITHKGGPPAAPSRRFPPVTFTPRRRCWGTQLRCAQRVRRTIKTKRNTSEF
jgi:hypothetical protein